MFAIVEQPKHGTATVDAVGTITYKPNVYDSRRDSFTIEATEPKREDGSWQTTRFVVTVHVANMGGAQHHGPKPSPGFMGVGCAPEIAIAKAAERAAAGSAR